MRPVVCVVVAAGRGRRMSAAGNKLLLQACGRPVLAWTLAVFERHPDVQRVYVTAAEDDIETYRAVVEREGLAKVAGVVRGGGERQESVHLALQHILARDTEASADPLVAIHDGARPLLTQQHLTEVLRAADEVAACDERGGALLCVDAKETLKRVRDGRVLETVPREQMMAAQTPQVFPLQALLRAHQRAVDEAFAATDDAMLIERLGGTVRAVRGDYENIKITTPEDLHLLETLLQRRAAASAPGSPR